MDLIMTVRTLSPAHSGSHVETSLDDSTEDVNDSSTEHGDEYNITPLVETDDMA